MKRNMVWDDLVVEELVDLALVPTGALAIYRVQKVDMTTLQVRRALAADLGIPVNSVVFSTRMDRSGTSVQYATLPAGNETLVEGEGYRAEQFGRCDEPVNAENLRGTHLRITIRDLALGEAQAVARRLRAVEVTGLPNYFDAQRLAYLPVDGEPMAKLMLQGDNQGALKSYLCARLPGDPRPLIAHKQEAIALWPDWEAMLSLASWPAEHARVLEFLVEHPDAVAEALGRIPHERLANHLAAYQYLLWNRIAGRYLELFCAENGVACGQISIGQERYPVHLDMPAGIAAGLGNKQVDLPYGHASYHPKAVAQAATEVLRGEGLQLVHLSTRLLEPLSLSHGSRTLLVVPSEVQVSRPKRDECTEGRYKLRLAFSLEKGSFASLVLQVATLDMAQEV